MTLAALVNAIRKLAPYGVAAYNRVDKLIEDYAKKEGISKKEARNRVRGEAEKRGINLGKALKKGGKTGVKRATKSVKKRVKQATKAGKKAVKTLT